MMVATRNSVRMLRLPEVINKTGLSRSTIYAKLQPSSPHYDPHFPKQIRLGAGGVGGARAVAWVEEEIEQWLQLKYEESNAALQYGNRRCCE